MYYYELLTFFNVRFSKKPYCHGKKSIPLCQEKNHILAYYEKNGQEAHKQDYGGGYVEKLLRS